MTRPVRKRTRQTAVAPALPANNAELTNNSELISVPADAESCPLGPNGESAAFEVLEDPDTLRLRQVLTMRMEGRTQKEIAEHFGKDTRTIRRWMSEAKQRKLKLSEHLAPDEALADFLYSFASQKIDLLCLKKTAEEAGDHRLVLRCLKELIRLDVTRMAVLEKLGLFTHMIFARSISDLRGDSGCKNFLKTLDDAIFGVVEKEIIDESQVDDDEKEAII